MDNNNFIKLVAKYLSKEATTKEVEDLNFYLRDKEYKEIFETISAEWENKPKNKIDYDVERGVKNLFAKIEKYEPVYKKNTLSKRRKSLFKEYLFKAAASIAFVSLITYTALVIFNFNNSGSEVVYIEKITEAGQKAIITLIDGTKITLNAESRLKYPVKYEEDKRLIELSGEAYFEVAKDKARPFTVISGNITTTALGTKFNVKAFPVEKKITVALVEGKVKVENKLNAGRDTGIILNEKERMHYDKNNKDILLDRFNPQEVIGWKDNVLMFKNRTLKEVITVVQRAYGVKIELVDTSLNNIKINANFENESFWTIIKALKAFTKLEYKTVDNNNKLEKVIFYRKEF